MAANIDNRIYVDGVKYPLTQAGINQAFTDACAINGGFQPGTTVYLPPMSITPATGWVVTCPLHIIGAGKGQTTIDVLTGKALTYRPSANFFEGQQFEVGYIELIASADDVIYLDASSGFPYYDPYIHDNVLISAPAAFAVNTNPVHSVNDSFNGKIARNTMTGVNLHGTATLGDSDLWMIEDNIFDSALGSNTTAAINLNCASGAAAYMVWHNLMAGWGGAGHIVSTGCVQVRIENNQMEAKSGTGSANGAMIDMQGTTYTINDCIINHNNINTHGNVTFGIRLDHVVSCTIEDNVFTIKQAAGAAGIVMTANASQISIPRNNFQTLGGGAVAVLNASAGSTWATVGPDGLEAYPSYGFISCPAPNGCGMYERSGVVEFSQGGTATLQIGGTGITVGQSGGNPTVGFANGSVRTTAPTANISWLASNSLGAGNGTPGNSSALFTAGKFLSNTNCAVNSVSPAACGAAASGAVVVPTTTATYTINTTVVTAASRIFLEPMSFAGNLPSTPTCVVPTTPFISTISAISAGVSFTFTLPSTTGQTCWQYWVVN